MSIITNFANLATLQVGGTHGESQRWGSSFFLNNPNIWCKGTWCMPCMQALAKSQEEYKRLSQYDIVYMYFANNSPEAKWKDAIEQHQIKGDNVVHFNLEPKEQNAIEQYFQVHSFPSYYLIDKEGNLLPYKVDGRDLDALEELIKRIRK